MPERAACSSGDAELMDQAQQAPAWHCCTCLADGLSKDARALEAPPPEQRRAAR